MEGVDESNAAGEGCLVLGDMDWASRRAVPVAGLEMGDPGSAYRLPNDIMNEVLSLSSFWPWQ
jgi:hypothetical protein